MKVMLEEIERKLEDAARAQTERVRREQEASNEAPIEPPAAE